MTAGDPWGLLAEGGPVLAILAVLSVLTLAILLLKLWQFARAGLLLGTPGPAALDRVAGPRLPAPVARLAALVLKEPRPPRLEAFLEQAAREELAVLQRGFRALETMGSLAPLLGLLGTVIGMIRAFGELGLAGGRPDPALLAGGIAQALLNTAGGLVVAVLATSGLALAEARVARCRLLMEGAVERAMRRAGGPGEPPSPGGPRP